jgi:hypothetical protein
MTYRGQFRQSRGSKEIEDIVTRPASPQGARLTLTGNLRSIFCQTRRAQGPPRSLSKPPRICGAPLTGRL